MRKNIIFIIFLCLGLVGILAIVNGFEAQSVTEEKRQISLAQVETKITRADQATEYETGIEVDLSQVKDEFFIEDAGNYILSGELKGNLCIDAEEQVVHLFLNNTTVSSPDGPAIRIYSAGKVIITILKGTKNYFYDSGKYEVPDEQEVDACIYSACDITFNGEGILEVYGYFKDAIHAKDKVKVLGSNLVLRAKREGIRANDGIYISNAEVSIECENDGLRTTKSGDGERGKIEIENGSISIIAGRYAINAENDLFKKNVEEYIKGIVADYYVNGETYNSEEIIQNE